MSLSECSPVPEYSIERVVARLVKVILILLKGEQYATPFQSAPVEYVVQLFHQEEP
jgi:hypothetical protein